MYQGLRHPVCVSNAPVCVSNDMQTGTRRSIVRFLRSARQAAIPLYNVRASFDGDVKRAFVRRPLTAAHFIQIQVRFWWWP